MEKVKKTYEAVKFAELLGVEFEDLSIAVIRGLTNLDIINNEGDFVREKISGLKYASSAILLYTLGRQREDYVKYFENLKIV